MSKLSQAVGHYAASVLRRFPGKAREKDVHVHEEPVDPVPLSPPLGYQFNEPLALQIRRMVRSEKLRQAAEEAGFETFEEANDFMIDEEGDWRSGYENDEDRPVEEVIAEIKAAGAARDEQRDWVEEQESEEAPPARTPSKPSKSAPGAARQSREGAGPKATTRGSARASSSQDENHNPE